MVCVRYCDCLRLSFHLTQDGLCKQMISIRMIRQILLWRVKGLSGWWCLSDNTREGNVSCKLTSNRRTIMVCRFYSKVKPFNWNSRERQIARTVTGFKHGIIFGTIFLGVLLCFHSSIILRNLNSCQTAYLECLWMNVFWLLNPHYVFCWTPDRSRRYPTVFPWFKNTRQLYLSWHCNCAFEIAE